MFMHRMECWQMEWLADVGMNPYRKWCAACRIEEKKSILMKFHAYFVFIHFLWFYYVLPFSFDRFDVIHFTHKHTHIHREPVALPFATLFYRSAFTLICICFWFRFFVVVVVVIFLFLYVTHPIRLTSSSSLSVVVSFNINRTSFFTRDMSQALV